VSERILSRRELNRALLTRQLLLDRPRLPVARALERVAGLQAQDARAPYIGLWSRLDGFGRTELTRALRARRIVKATLMRGTLHLVSARDYGFFLPALLPTLRDFWRRYRSGLGQVSGVDELAARALTFAAEPRSATELRAFLGGDDPWFFVRMHAPFLHAPTGDDWAFRRSPSLVAAEAWLERPPDTEAGGVVHLLRRYLSAFGPASLPDAATWSGLPISALRTAADLLPLKQFRSESGHVLLDLRGAPLPPPETPAPVRLLPPFDNLVLSHADRTRVVSDEDRRTIIRGGIVDPIFLVDGFVAGRWRLERGKIALEPFRPLPAGAEDALREEAGRLEEFLA